MDQTIVSTCYYIKTDELVDDFMINYESNFNTTLDYKEFDNEMIDSHMKHCYNFIDNYGKDTQIIFSLFIPCPQFIWTVKNRVISIMNINHYILRIPSRGSKLLS